MATTPAPAVTGAYNAELYSAELLTLMAGQPIKAGWLVGVNPSTGKAVPAGSPNSITIGRAESDAPAVDDPVRIRRGAFGYPADSSLTLDDKLVGKVAYAQNQSSVTTASSANARPAGIVLGVIPSGLIIDTTTAPAIPVPTA